ncbi:adenosylcobinamide amidohydrolase [Anoxybacillus tepidamans]|uniref:adenosylcobinamide amidohydrolase n=1 Tax=Anoxybacteroides tepidamans TaxID=265948 RepID=UPI0004870F76
MLNVCDISHRYDDKTVLQKVAFEVEKGEFFGILGPNGSGKTTLLKLLSRELPLQEGAITLNGVSLASLSSKQLAQWIAVLPQNVDIAFGYTVKETVELGRYAHQRGLFAKWTDADERAVSAALAQVGMLAKETQTLDRLSGGERQRVYLARALVQEPSLLLLDEPTNHMDISQQILLLDQLKQWTKEKQLTVIAIFHDINLASMYCDRLLLLHEGKVANIGEPSDLIEEEMLKSVFGASVRRQAHPVVASPLITFVPNVVQENEEHILDSLTITGNREQIVVASPRPLKVLSSAVVGAGFQWATHFVNRHVPKDYDCDDPEEEMRQYLRNRSFDVHQTIGMMTAVYLEDAVIVRQKEGDVSLVAIVTAGVGNAVDASVAWKRTEAIGCAGTINIVVLIEGKLTEAAYVQAMMTATEAKAKALCDAGVVDPETGTIATGTSTDCLAIAASQTGPMYEYAGTVTPLGKALGRLVYEATAEALQKYKKRRGEAR